MLGFQPANLYLVYHLAQGVAVGLEYAAQGVAVGLKYAGLSAQIVCRVANCTTMIVPILSIFKERYHKINSKFSASTPPRFTTFL
jgi:hypothetical protein